MASPHCASACASQVFQLIKDLRLEKFGEGTVRAQRASEAQFEEHGEDEVGMGRQELEITKAS